MREVNIARNLLCCRAALIGIVLLCGLSFVLTGQAQDEGGYELISGDFGISGESSGGGYSQVGSVLMTDGNEMSGGGFTVTEESVLVSTDCLIGFEDFARFASYWMQSGAGLPADLYEDGFVDYDDLLDFANLWLCICPSNWPLK